MHIYRSNCQDYVQYKLNQQQYLITTINKGCTIRPCGAECTKTSNYAAKMNGIYYFPPPSVYVITTTFTSVKIYNDQYQRSSPAQVVS